MNIPPFEKQKITTITAVVPLVGKINIPLAYRMIVITIMDMPEVTMPKKFKIPYCGVPGAIVSSVHSGMTKGIPRSKRWPNGIVLDIATSKKNVNIKLSSDKIQICGAD
jgi:hypothetical protein